MPRNLFLAVQAGAIMQNRKTPFLMISFVVVLVCIAGFFNLKQTKADPNDPHAHAQEQADKHDHDHEHDKPVATDTKAEKDSMRGALKGASKPMADGKVALATDGKPGSDGANKVPDKPLVVADQQVYKPEPNETSSTATQWWEKENAIQKGYKKKKS